MLAFCSPPLCNIYYQGPPCPSATSSGPLMALAGQARPGHGSASPRAMQSEASPPLIRKISHPSLTLPLVLGMRLTGPQAL